MGKKLLNIIISTVALSCVMFFISSIVRAATLQDRLWGNDRYETNSKIVDLGWTSSQYAVIASGEGFADALCAAPLAEEYKAPILLTAKDALSLESKNQLSKLKVKKVFIIGGTGVISDNVKSEIESMSIETTRIYGQDRFKTAVEVAKNLKNVTGVVVTNGYGFADALSIAPIAAQKGMPILLTDKGDLSSSVKDFLDNNSYTKSYIVGGTGVVSDNIASQLKDNTRLAGDSRYATNAAVLNQFASELSYNKVYVVSGENYPDALSGSVLAASNNSPLILVGASVDSSVMSSVKAQHDKYNNIVVLGSTAVVSDESANNIVSGVDNTIVTFKDNKLEQAVRDAINKPTGDIYKSDAAKITELQYAADAPDCIQGESGIGDLSGIENLENLEVLDLGCNHISDITPLKGLTKLKDLELYRNQISDISALKGLINLQDLNLYMNSVSDTSGLKGLTKLESIDLQRNQVSDISGLKGLTNLKVLSLSGNQISDTDVQSLQEVLPNCQIDLGDL